MLRLRYFTCVFRCTVARGISWIRKILFVARMNDEACVYIRKEERAWKNLRKYIYAFLFVEKITGKLIYLRVVAKMTL